MEKTETTMSRGEFLRNLGLSGAALMSFYCLGTLSACSSKNDDPQPNNPGTGGTKVDFTLNLADGANSALGTAGGFVYNGNIIIARTGSGDNDFAALSKVCTHQGTTVTYQAANNRFHCPNHFSNFSITGSVINGPATVALKQYNVSRAGNSLRVFES